MVGHPASMTRDVSHRGHVYIYSLDTFPSILIVLVICIVLYLIAELSR